MSKTAATEDIQNTEAWAVVISHILHLMPTEQRATVLELALKDEECEKAKREEDDEIIMIDDLGWKNSPGARHWNAIMRLKALVIQVFARNVTNNHSPTDAAE